MSGGLSREAEAAAVRDARRADAITRARALVYDHAHALHEDHYDPTVGCQYPGCEAAFGYLASIGEPTL